MAISLYDALIPGFRQIVGAAAGLVDKAEAHCAAQDLPHDDLVQARLIPDMLPFAYQIRSVADHSIGAIEGVRKGVYAPNLSAPPASFADLKSLMAKAEANLAALDAAEINGFEGQDMRFEFNDYRIDFTAENFLLSFSQPNFYFHATTAYDVLRAKGVKLGKTMFLGAMRTKG